MENKLYASLAALNVDIETALRRFMGNDEMYRKFLLKFANDNNVEILGTYIDKRDWAAALSTAHSLKGVTGNLGFDTLYAAFTAIVSDIRAEKYNGVYLVYKNALEAYRKIYSAIIENS